MRAYLVIDLNVTDLDGFMEYVHRIPELIQKHDGRYLVQGVEPTVIEASDSKLERSVIIEFPSRVEAEAFLEERSKSELHEIWSRTTDSRILLVEGST